MHAVVCPELGPLDNLRIDEQPDPTAGPGQVVVQVVAAGVNYVDALFVQGQYQIKPPTPFTPGGEIAGQVASIGEGVTGFAVGDRVIASIGLGGFAEQVIARVEQLAPIPEAMTFEAAATFTQSYATALFSLDRRANLQDGEWLLVLGAAGGVGRAAIDVGRALGARVIAAASSPERLELCVAAGAEATINYTTEDLKTRARELSGGGTDVVVDPVGDDKAEPALRSLGFDGRFLVIGFAGGDIPRIPLNQVLLRNRRIVGVDWGAWMLANPDGQRDLMGELLAMVADGRLHPPEPTTYPLTDAVRALDDLQHRKVAGKIALIP
jgi:NADPH2:quinone reductase